MTLVRDRIPEIIKAAGKEPICRQIHDAELHQALKAKLREEAEEFRIATTREQELEELTDICEIIDALLAYYGTNPTDFTTLRQNKASARGGFENGVFLEEVRPKLDTVADVLNDTIDILQNMGCKLSGDGSPLSDVWEEIKYQIQVEESHSWDVYEETIRALIEGTVEEMTIEQRQKIKDELIYADSDDPDGISNNLYEKLLEGAGDEEINYESFDFICFRYTANHGITVYCQVLKRTAFDRCLVRAFSVDTPDDGECGEMEMENEIIDEFMTEKELQEARKLNWPNNWERRYNPSDQWLKKGLQAGY